MSPSSIDVLLFFVYSELDEKLWEKMEMHLASLLSKLHIKQESFKLRKANQSNSLDSSSQYVLDAADIIVFLVTPSFMGLKARSRAYQALSAQALNRQRQERIPLIPVILRSTSGWQEEFGHLKFLPSTSNGVGIMDSSKPNALFVEVAVEIDKQVKRLEKSRDDYRSFLSQLFQDEYYLGQEFIERLRAYESQVELTHEDIKFIRSSVEKDYERRRERYREFVLPMYSTNSNNSNTGTISRKRKDLGLNELDALEIERSARSEVGRVRYENNLKAVLIASAFILCLFVSLFYYMWVERIGKFIYQCQADTMSGAFEQAVENCTQAININPESSNLYVLRGDIYFDKGEYSLASEDYSKAYNLDQNKVYLKEKILEAQEKIFALKREKSEKFYTQGLTDYNLGSADSAIANYEEAIKISASDPRFFDARGNALLYLKGDYQRAILDYKVAEKLISENPSISGGIMLSDLYYKIAFSLYNLGIWNESSHYYGRAIQYDSENVSYRNELGNLYFFHKEDWERARQSYTKAIELNPQNSHAYHYRGESSIKLGDLKNGVLDLQTAAALYQEEGNLAEHQKIKQMLAGLQSE